MVGAPGCLPRTGRRSSGTVSTPMTTSPRSATSPLGREVLLGVGHGVGLEVDQGLRVGPDPIRKVDRGHGPGRGQGQGRGVRPNPEVRVRIGAGRSL